jgi:hypothetical protein
LERQEKTMKMSIFNKIFINNINFVVLRSELYSTY